MSETLLPCPFSSAASVHAKPDEVYASAFTYAFVTCRTCGATGPKRDTREKAIAAWNQRADGELVSKLSALADDLALDAEASKDEARRGAYEDAGRRVRRVIE